MYKIAGPLIAAVLLMVVVVCAIYVRRPDRAVSEAYRAIENAKKNDSTFTVEAYKNGWLKGYLQCARHMDEIGFYDYDSDMKRSAYDFSQNWIK